MALGLVAGGVSMITRDLDTDVRAWDTLKAKYPMVEVYHRAWTGALMPSEAEIFWTFGAGIEFKVWCARQFLTELKAVVEDLKR